MALIGRRAKAYLQLVRLPNAFTAVADVTAGMLLTQQHLSAWPQWCLLAPASLCLYAGGVALNDVCDEAKDRLERPERPIPSGLVLAASATSLSVGLLITGVALAAACAPRAGVIAAVLTVSILLYNVALKETPVAPAMMGICRALNLALGMYVVIPPETIAAAAPLSLMWLYVTSLTVFARKEATGGSPTRLTAATIGMVIALLGTLLLQPFAGGHRATFVIGVIALAGYVALEGLQATRATSGVSTQRAVKHLVLGIVLFDACLAWTTAGPVGAAIVAAWLLPAAALSRPFRVT